MHFYRKCWFDLFAEQFISLLNFDQNYFVQLRWNWFSVRLPVTNDWNCHSLYTAFSNILERGVCEPAYSYTLTKLKNLLLQTHWANFNQLCIYGWWSRTQVYSNIRPYLFSRGDDYELAKIHWQNLKIQNRWANFNQTWHNASLDEGDLSVRILIKLLTRNTLTQTSKNDRKSYLFSKKKFVSMFYAINILNTSIISNRQTLIVRRENAFCIFHTFPVLFTLFLVYHDLKQKLNKMYWCPEVWKVYLNYSKCTWKVLILLY